MRRATVKVDPGAGLAQAGELRRAFDLSFAEAPPTAIGAVENLVEIRLGATRYALRLTEIAGLFADVRITPVPTTVPELLGIGGLRGSILPVYDLQALLGYPAGTELRWLAIASAMPVGLAFAAFERQVSVRAGAVVPHAAGGAMRHVGEVVHFEGVARPILSVASVLEAITIRVRAAGSQQE
jgi:chemotaxis signal transduction protein